MEQIVLMSEVIFSPMKHRELPPFVKLVTSFKELIFSCPKQRFCWSNFLEYLYFMVKVLKFQLFVPSFFDLLSKAWVYEILGHLPY